MKISIILPVYNESEHISRCLESLRLQTLPSEDFEIIVVDGGSTDDTCAQVQKAKIWAGDRLCLLENPAKTTAHALNIGLLEARGDIIARVDGHSTVSPQYLAELLGTLADPLVWAAGAAVTNGDSSRRATAVWAALCSRLGCGGSPYRETGKVLEVESVQGAAYRREVFDRVGNFDTAMLYAEDDEFNYRVRAAGGIIILRGDLAISYFPRTTYRGLVRQMFNYGRGRVRMLGATNGTLRPKHVVPTIWLLAQALMFIEPLAPLMLGLWAAYLSLILSARPPHPVAAIFIYPIIHFAYGAGVLRETTQKSWSLVKYFRRENRT